MNRTAYILTFDRDDNLDYKSFHKLLINCPSVITWWHYIKSCYILISETKNATILQQEIKGIIPNKRFLLIEVNLKNRNGWLPLEAWEWIRKQTLKIK